MIRLADRGDLDKLESLIMAFLNDTSYNQLALEVDPAHIRRLCHTCLHLGYIWLYEVDDEAVGLFVATREPNTWAPHLISLKELVWYVKPEYRGTPGAAKLFLTFQKTADEMLLNKQIQGYFVTRMESTAAVDLIKRGFRPVERLYIKD
jgi:hypothetical protein